MVRPTKRTVKEAEGWAKTVDRFTTEVDINMVLCGVAGGLASYGGLVPPFTRLLMTISQMAPGGAGIDIGKSVNIDYTHAAAFLSPMGLVGGGAGYLFGSIVKKQLTDAGTPEAAAEAQAKAITSSALFMSGALEAMLMYKAFSNAEIAKALIAMPGEVLKGIGAIVPG